MPKILILLVGFITNIQKKTYNLITGFERKTNNSISYQVDFNCHFEIDT